MTSGTSTSPKPGRTSTPPLNVPANQVWTDIGVTVHAGAASGISASSAAYIAAARSSQGPGGNPSCSPLDYAEYSRFPAPQMPCWSLVARIGNSPAFEVGTSTLITATTTGRLYLGLNDDSFSSNTGIWTARIKVGGLP